MKQVAQSITLLAVALLVSFGIAEVMARIFAPYTRDHVVPPGMFAIDSKLGWKLQPGFSGRHKTRYFDQRYTINALGFRDRPRSPEKPDSVRRLLFLGDSQIFGWGVEMSERFGDLADSAHTRLEIWNMGVPGYGLDQEVIAYESASETIPSNGVIFYVSRSTLARSKSGFIYGKTKPRLIRDSSGTTIIVPPEARSTATRDLVYRVFSRFYLPYFVEEKIRKLTGKYSLDLAGPGDTVSPATMELAKVALARAVAVAAEHHHRIYVVTALSGAALRELTAFCEKNGIVVLATGWSATPINLVLGKLDRHWNAALNSQLAERFGSRLASP